MKIIRNLLALLLLLGSTIMNGQNKTLTGSKEFPLTENAEIIDFVTGADGLTYVFLKTGYPQFKTLIHVYDSNLKFIKKKPLAENKCDGGIFNLNRIFRIGDRIMMLGNAYNEKKKTSDYYLSGFDLKSMNSDKKFTLLQSTPNPVYSFGNRDKISLCFSPDLKYTGIVIDYASVKQTGESSYNTTYLHSYYLLNDKIEVKNCSAGISDNEHLHYFKESMLITSDGEFLVAETEKEKLKIEEESEYWKSKENRIKLAEAKSSLVINRFSFNRPDEHYTIITGEDDFTVTKLYLKEISKQIFITGFINNRAAIYKQNLLNDKAWNEDEILQLFYFQPFSFSKPEFRIDDHNTVLITEKLKRELFDDPDVTEDDARISADTRLEFSAAWDKGENRFVIAAAQSTEWSWPPVAEMEKNPAYKIEKDEKGEVISFSGPHYPAKYHERDICLISYHLGDSVFSLTKIKRDNSYSEQNEFFGGYNGTVEKKTLIVYEENSKINLYYVNMNKGSENKELKSYSSTEQEQTITGPDHKGALADVIANPGAPGLLLFFNEKGYNLVRLD